MKDFRKQRANVRRGLFKRKVINQIILRPLDYETSQCLLEVFVFPGFSYSAKRFLIHTTVPCFVRDRHQISPLIILNELIEFYSP